jgi:hypothetical protein
MRCSMTVFVFSLLVLLAGDLRAGDAAIVIENRTARAALPPPPSTSEFADLLRTDVLQAREVLASAKKNDPLQQPTARPGGSRAIRKRLSPTSERPWPKTPTVDSPRSRSASWRRSWRRRSSRGAARCRLAMPSHPPA